MDMEKKSVRDAFRRVRPVISPRLRRLSAAWKRASGTQRSSIALWLLGCLFMKKDKD